MTPPPKIDIALNVIDHEAPCEHGTEGAARDPSICSVCVYAAYDDSQDQDALEDGND